MTIRAAHNTGFASGGVTCKLGALYFYSSSVQVDSFVLLNPPHRQAETEVPPFSGTSGGGFPSNKYLTHCLYSGIVKFPFAHIWIDTQSFVVLGK
ncbi:MAG: hypothetical protein ACK5C0_01955 [Candidatus Kapaibacterium sp.]|jgi:hypothetical protein